MAEIIHSHMCEGVDLKGKREVAKQTLTLVIYIIPRKSYPCSEKNDSEHGCQPIHCRSMEAMTKEMATRDTMWIHTFMTQLTRSHKRIQMWIYGRNKYIAMDQYNVDLCDNI